MKHAWIAGVLFAAALAAGCGRPGSPEPAAAADAYVPGLGEIMSANQMRHLKLWYAGQAGNWPLAAYEVDELEEGFADAVHFHPHHKDSPEPLTKLVPEYTDGPVAELRKAIEQKSRPTFVTAFESLTQGCNGCHIAAGFGFNVVRVPTSNPYSNQRFEPSQ